MTQGSDDEMNRTIDILNQGDPEIMKNEESLKIILIHQVINISGMPNNMIEKILLK